MRWRMPIRGKQVCVVHKGLRIILSYSAYMHVCIPISLYNTVEDANKMEAGVCVSHRNSHHTFITFLHVCMHSHFSV